MIHEPLPLRHVFFAHQARPKPSLNTEHGPEIDLVGRAALQPAQILLVVHHKAGDTAVKRSASLLIAPEFNCWQCPVSDAFALLDTRQRRGSGWATEALSINP